MAWAKITSGLTAFLKNSNSNGYIIGLSGGIDSALTATLAVEAVGADRVLGIMMPGPYSSPNSVSDASTLAANLRIETLSLPITAAYDVLKAQYSGVVAEYSANGLNGVRPQIEDAKQNVALQNLQARLRAVHLMFLANSRNLLVLNTGNKSEAAMGYSTLYGDTIGAIAPLGDLYKTQVYALANYYNSTVVPECTIPSAIIDKAPSAELYEGQMDTDALLPYDLLDMWLYQFVELGVSAQTVSEQSQLSVEQGNELVKAIETAKFKRKCEPPVIALNSVSFNQFDTDLPQSH